MLAMNAITSKNVKAVHQNQRRRLSDSEMYVRTVKIPSRCMHYEIPHLKANAMHNEGRCIIIFHCNKSGKVN